MSVVLVATVAQGVNEDELGDILRFGLEHPALLGVSYQPMTFAGPQEGTDPTPPVWKTLVGLAQAIPNRHGVSLLGFATSKPGFRPHTCSQHAFRRNPVPDHRRNS